MNPGHTIPVLDHGFVRYVDHYGSDQRIVEAARISYRSPSKGETEDKKLIHYLWKNRHTSPFEMVKVTLNIKMPIFVMRQYVRHRMQNLNEVSARYTELPNEFYVPSQWRTQDSSNRQSSRAADGIQLPVPWCVLDIDGSSFMSSDPTIVLAEYCKSAYKLYQEMLQVGIAREMARMVLPLNIYTEIYACWDLKNILHFVTLREDAHAQAEIQEYGKAIRAILTHCFPWTMEAYDKYKFVLKDSYAT